MCQDGCIGGGCVCLLSAVCWCLGTSVIYSNVWVCGSVSGGCLDVYVCSGYGCVCVVAMAVCVVAMAMCVWWLWLCVCGGYGCVCGGYGSVCVVAMSVCVWWLWLCVWWIWLCVWWLCVWWVWLYVWWVWLCVYMQCVGIWCVLNTYTAWVQRHCLADILYTVLVRQFTSLYHLSPTTGQLTVVFYIPSSLPENTGVCVCRSSPVAALWLWHTFVCML